MQAHWILEAAILRASWKPTYRTHHGGSTGSSWAAFQFSYGNRDHNPSLFLWQSASAVSVVSTGPRMLQTNCFFVPGSQSGRMLLHNAALFRTVRINRCTGRWIAGLVRRRSRVMFCVCVYLLCWVHLRKSSIGKSTKNAIICTQRRAVKSGTFIPHNADSVRDRKSAWQVAFSRWRARQSSGDVGTTRR